MNKTISFTTKVNEDGCFNVMRMSLCLSLFFLKNSSLAFVHAVTGARKDRIKQRQIFWKNVFYQYFWEKT